MRLKKESNVNSTINFLKFYMLSLISYTNKRASELSIFYIFVLLLWLKSYFITKFYFDIDIENKFQEVILFISPLSFSILFVSLLILLSGIKNRRYIFILGSILSSFILYGNIIFYRFYTDFVTIPVLFQTSNMSDLGGSLLGSLEWFDIFVFVDILILFYLLFIRKQSVSEIRYREGSFGLILAFLVFILNLGLSETERPELLTRTFDREILVKNLGIYNYHLYDIYTQGLTKSRKEFAESNDLLNVEEYILEESLSDSEKLNSFSGLAKDKNVIFVALESLQTSFVGERIEDKEVTPFLNSIIADSYYFPNVYHQTAQGKSSDSEFVIDTSWYPLGRGSVYFTHASNTYKGLPFILANNGYSTSSFHANNKSFWNRDIMYKKMGYEKYYDLDYYNVDESNSVGWGLKDDFFFSQSIDYMKNMSEPFFSKLITLTNHHPFELYGDDIKLANYYSNSNTLNKYVSSVNYLDFSIESLFSELKSSGLYDNSIIVMYGDHYGISELHNKAMATYLNKGKVDNNFLSEYDISELQKVPLFIHIPGETDNGNGKIIDTVGGQIDIKPTVLNLLGISSGNDLQFGRDLLSDNHDNKVIFRDGSVMSKDLISTENSCYVRPEYAKSYLNYFEIHRQDDNESDFNYFKKYESYLNSRFIDVLKENQVDKKIIEEYENLLISYLSFIKENKNDLINISKSSSDIDNEFDLSAYSDVFNKLNLGYNEYVNLISDKEFNSDSLISLNSNEIVDLNDSKDSNLNTLYDFINFVKLNDEKFNSGYKVDISLCSDLKDFGKKELNINDKLIYGDLLRFESSIEPELNNLENEKLQEELMREMSE